MSAEGDDALEALRMAHEAMRDLLHTALHACDGCEPCSTRQSIALDAYEQRTAPLWERMRRYA